MKPLEESLKEAARELGFDLVGIAAAEPADDFPAYLAWLDQGHAGDMAYLHRHAQARRHPASILDSVRSIVMLGMHYQPPKGESSAGVPQGRIARYALGGDYHKILWKKLDQLLLWVQEQVPGAAGRGVVDTAPLLERGVARRAGLGWFGKNTMLIHGKQGSYFFLAALLLSLDLKADAPFQTQHCGTCTACLDACPTDAFVAPYQLDARRCISYLTIEQRGPIDAELRAGIGDWLFGCDICQEVCPWNRSAPVSREPGFAPRPGVQAFDLAQWVSLSEEEYRIHFAGTALTRAKRAGLRRNAAIVAGNRGDPSLLPALREAALDEDPVVREAAQWAIARIENRQAERSGKT